MNPLTHDYQSGALVHSATQLLALWEWKLGNLKMFNDKPLLISVPRSLLSCCTVGAFISWFDCFSESGSEICQILVGFWENFKTSKRHSEIIWPLEQQWGCVSNLSVSEKPTFLAGISFHFRWFVFRKGLSFFQGVLRL